MRRAAFAFGAAFGCISHFAATRVAHPQTRRRRTRCSAGRHRQRRSKDEEAAHQKDDVLAPADLPMLVHQRAALSVFCLYVFCAAKWSPNSLRHKSNDTKRFVKASSRDPSSRKRCSRWVAAVSTTPGIATTNINATTKHPCT